MAKNENEVLKKQNEEFRTELSSKDGICVRLMEELAQFKEQAATDGRNAADTIGRLKTHNAKLDKELMETKADLRDVFIKINNAVIEIIQKHQ